MVKGAKGIRSERLRERQYIRLYAMFLESKRVE